MYEKHVSIDDELLTRFLVKALEQDFSVLELLTF